jgi:hypothetical protein
MKTKLALFIAILMAFVPAVHAAAKKPKPAAKPEKVDPKVFLTKFDEDKDSKLDKKELGTGLKSLKTNSVTTKNDSWKRFDTDGDGKINLNELTKLLAENK